MDRREKILEILELFKVNEERSKDKAAPFKVLAYKNAIKAIIEYNKPIVNKNDADQIQGIGKKIRAKLYEIIETGDLEEAKELKTYEMVRKELLDIYGVGPKKADDLIDNYNVRNLNDLIGLVEKDRNILTQAQLLGLIYYDDFKLRIPRTEITEYEIILNNFFREYAPDFKITVVGSYRRGAVDSGDIDILVSYEKDVFTDKEAKQKFRECIDKLIELEYIVGVLAKGDTKLLLAVQLPGYEIARRLDMLLTPPNELACALLYFTGSVLFNTEFRKVALLKGYTLNEHRLKKIKETIPSPEVPEFNTEEDVFEFLGIKYQSPPERVGPVELIF